MNASHHPTIAALLSLATILVGCASGGDETSYGLNVSGLTETRTFPACTEQLLKVTRDASNDAVLEYTWNVVAPVDAQFTSSPNVDELRFAARTPGEYAISVSECRSTSSSDVDCVVTEFSVTVIPGADLNGNGIGDRCESSACTPACEGRTCGLDPVCHQSCGSCGAGQTCDEAAGQCKAACVPACDGRTCGFDPVCNTSCGTCGSGQTCDEAAGQCKAACVPACDGRTCGLDPICHTSCGTCSAENSCNSEGKCVAATAKGRVVTIVMAITDKRLSFTDARFNQRTRLIEQSVQWVSPVPNPKVLVVLDDNCADWSREAQLIRSTLVKRGFSATLINEPAEGLRNEQLQQYDVVWFTNPALPVDDAQSIASLRSFAENGGGVVLQGDDITQPAALEPLTQLHYESNGKYSCGQYIDDDRGSSYKVNIERNTHPVVANLVGNTYYYGDDIDASTLTARTKAVVLAWAQVGGCHRNSRGSSQCPKQPVIVAHDLMND